MKSSIEPDGHQIIQEIRNVSHTLAVHTQEDAAQFAERNRRLEVIDKDINKHSKDLIDHACAVDKKFDVITSKIDLIKDNHLAHLEKSFHNLDVTAAILQVEIKDIREALRTRAYREWGVAIIVVGLLLTSIYRIIIR